MRVTTADRLKQIMDERHLRQVDIIKLCEPYCATIEVKLTKSDLSQFVNGKVSPGQWKISILSHALNVNEAWLMGYDVPRERATEEQVQFVMDAFANHKQQLADQITELLSNVPSSMQESLLALATLPPADLQRVLDFAEGLRAAHKG